MKTKFSFDESNAFKLSEVKIRGVIMNSGRSLSLEHFVSPRARWARLSKRVARIADSLLGLSAAEALYRRTLNRCVLKPLAEEFVPKMHAEMRLSIHPSPGSTERIPESGPLIVVANHPFGGIETTVLLETMLSVRKDVKFLANHLLEKIPSTRDRCIYVDPFEGKEAWRKNVSGLREALSWVRGGNALCVFPAGAVSHLQLSRAEISDPEWSATIGRLVRLSQADVLPVCFHGRNGFLFQLAGVVHPRLRTLLLVREFVNKCNSTINFRVGNLIKAKKLAKFENDRALSSYLRLRTYILASSRNEEKQYTPFSTFPLFNRARKLKPVVGPAELPVMERELALLERRRLASVGDFKVYCARAKQIPAVLKEIGRLRELSFRQANEGTGNSIDLDTFDNYYLHLFVWNDKKHELVGAYRLARTDSVERHLGVAGLYTNLLFKYGASLLQNVGPSLELGRSFVRPEYQKNAVALFALWRGIGEYVRRNPRYRKLFGAVSFNNEYNSVSRNLIRHFLRANSFKPELAKLVKPRNPIRDKRLKGVDSISSFAAKDLSDISELLAELESRHTSLPVLLRQYLKLGGKLLAFNLDKYFGNVMDGLILVDLVETEEKLLERYFGADGAAEFLNFHGISNKSALRSGTDG